MDEALVKKIVAMLKPSLDASLDALCIVNSQNEIVHLNLPMKSLLGLRGRELKKKKLVFCNTIKLAACEHGCQIQNVLRTGHPLRLDESPAVRANKKLRVLLKATPIPDYSDPKGKPIGAIITVRDTTAELLLQAKYHKLIGIVGDRDAKIAALEERINALQTALRRARHNAVA